MTYRTVFLLVLFLCLTFGEKIGKKVTDFNDVDVEKLLDQWNVSIYFYFLLTLSGGPPGSDPFCR